LEKNLLKRLLLILCLLVTNSVYANSYGLYNFEDLKYENQKSITEVRPIASITKLFTAYTVITSNVDLDEKVKVQGKSSGRFARGAYIERYELMRAMLMSSDNLAAESLANAHPGGFKQFIQDANNEITFQGLKHTVVVDATGLLPGNVSTVDELKDFLYVLRKFDVIRFYSSERYYAIKYQPPKAKKSITIQLKNTNPQLFYYDEIVLTKTGFTNPAGRCLAMLVEKNGILYAMITLGNKDVRQRSGVINDMFNIYVNHD